MIIIASHASLCQAVQYKDQRVTESHLEHNKKIGHNSS